MIRLFWTQEFVYYSQERRITNLKKTISKIIQKIFREDIVSRKSSLSEETATRMKSIYRVSRNHSGYFLN